MKELSILAGLRDGPCEILKVDPYLTITEITEHLRRKFKQNNVVVQDAEVDLYDDYWAEYGLYMYSAGHYAGGEWLDDTKKLSEYDTSLKVIIVLFIHTYLNILFLVLCVCTYIFVLEGSIEVETKASGNCIHNCSSGSPHSLLRSWPQNSYDIKYFSWEFKAYYFVLLKGDVMVEISRALPAPDRANLSKYGLYLDSNDITKTGVSFIFN